MLNLWHRRETKRPLDPIRLDVLRAVKKPGCPICRVQREWSERFYLWLLIQNYCAETMVIKLKESGGLCCHHAEKLLEPRSVYTTSVMHEYLVKDAIAKLHALADQARQKTRKPSRKPHYFSATPTGKCPACVDDEETVQGATRTLVAALNEDEVVEQYRAGDALCMPHFYRTVELASPSIVVLLTETQIAKLDVLTHDFAEYFRKVGYRFANEPKGDEQTAWKRAIVRLAGGQD